MPDLRGCSRAVVERALRASEIRSDFAPGPSDAAAGAVYDQDPKPGGAIKPGMLATIRVSDGTSAAMGDGTVAGASASGPAVVGPTPAAVTSNDGTPIDATATGTTPTGTTPTDTASVDTTPTDAAPADSTVANSTPSAALPADGTTVGEMPVDPAMPGTTTDGSTTIGGTTDGATTTGDATAGAAIIGDTTSGGAIVGAATTGAVAPGNDAGLVAVPSSGPGAVPVGVGPGKTEAREGASNMPVWWWAVLALAVTLILAGVTELARQRRIRRLRPAWEQRVHAHALLSPQGDATPTGEIPLAAMPFAVVASLGFAEATAIGEIRTYTQEA